MQEIKLPNLGEGIKSGTVVRVLVNQGDIVRPQQTLIELETDKALIEVPSDLAGTVMAVLVGAGETIAVGQVLLQLDATTESAAEAQPSPPEAPAAASAAAPPVISGSSTAPAPSHSITAATPQPQNTGSADVAPPQVTPAAGPTTRRLARELGVELARVQGSGRGGRVTREDVLRHVQQAMQSVPGTAAPPPEIDLPDFSQWGAIALEPLNAVRRTTAQHLGRSWPVVPLVTQFDDADITDLEALRQRFKPDGAERHVHLTLTVLLLKALSTGLTAQPRFNCTLDLQREQLVLKQYQHFGIAVDTPRGLLLPVLRDVEHKDIWQLSAELEALVTRARAGQIELGELRGASFSLSNQGGIGGTHFTPLVNHPEVAILGVGQARTQPLWDAAAAQFKPRLMLPLALSYDHRVLDGADAARFIAGLKRRLEDPARLLAGM